MRADRSAASIASVDQTSRSVSAADAAFLAAVAGSPTAAAQELALTTHDAAMKLAEATFKSAVAALGVAPVRPIKPAELVKPPVPVKPADPAKPVAPVKPSKEQNNGNNNSNGNAQGTPKKKS